jgi:PhzF family phenazine biosynthesis protein
MRFFILDAFAQGLFGGNPAGVVLLGQSEPFPDDGVMRRAAAELRYSETVFVRKEAAGGRGDGGAAPPPEYRLRYFTPVEEVDLCGHATIAAFHVIGSEPGGGRSWIALAKAGRLRVENTGGLVMMDMAPPRDVAEIHGGDEAREVYGCLGIDPPAQGSLAWGWAPEIISTGLPDIILPVGTEEELAAAKPRFDAIREISKKYGVVGVHAFAAEGTAGGPEEGAEEGQVFHCRNFAPLYGIDEEAATGTANGGLTWYLYKKGRVNEGARVCFIQGEAMGRPSRVYGALTEAKSAPRIQIGGRCALLARGEIFLA